LQVLDRTIVLLHVSRAARIFRPKETRQS
jgi:hypothetical protein